jgi:predicted NUDIX family NTP pyrophosphohydrolase
VGYRVSTSDVFRFDRRDTGAGTVAHATIQNLPNGQAFLARDGIRVFNGTTAPLIEADIMDEIREGANPQYIYKAISKLVREKDEYWVALPIGSQTEPETVYKYNYRTGQVHKDYRTNLTAFGEFEATDQVTWDDIETSWDAYPARWNDVINLSSAPTISIGHSDGTVTKRQGVYNDDEAPIDAFWTSKDFGAPDFGVDDPGKLLRWQGMDLWAKGSSLVLSYSTDCGLTWTVVKTQTLESDYPSDSSPIRIYFDFVSSKARFKFRNADDDSAFTLKQFMAIATLREGRK